MFRIFLLALVMAFAVAACSRTAVQNAPTASPTASRSTAATAVATAGQATAVVNVAMKESSIVPDRVTAQSGEITFRVQNLGTVKHQFLVVKTELSPNALPMLADGSRADEAKLDKVLTVSAIEPGKSTDAKVALAPGAYVLLSNDPTQYKAGMIVAFTVTP